MFIIYWLVNTVGPRGLNNFKMVGLYEDEKYYTVMLIILSLLADEQKKNQIRMYNIYCLKTL